MMPTLLLILYPILAVILFLFFQNYKSLKNQALPRGPTGLPIVGNLHQLDFSVLPQQLWQLSKKHGPHLFSLKLGVRPAIVVSSPELAKETLKDHDLEFSGRPKLLALQKLSYNGLDIAFSQYNASWRETRKICVTHILSARRVSSFSPIREFEVKHMIKKISGHASSSKVTNLSDILMSLTSTMICRIAFGRRYEDEGVERSKFHGLFNEIQELLAGSSISDYIPMLGWIDRLTGLHARLERVYKEMDQFYQEVIDEHMDPDRKASDGEDIIDVLLQLKKHRSFAIDLTIDHIKAVFMNMLIGATDTMAATTIWTMTALMKNPRVMKKVQEEVRSLGGNKDFLGEDDVQKFTYVKAVIKETLRFYPPVPLVVRETIEKCIINGYNIPAKTLVYVNVWAIQRDPKAWKNPEEFYPERFLDSTTDFRGQDFELIPFGAGRRICPGYPMAVASVDLILSNLLYSFDWELPQGMKREDIDVETMQGLAQHKKKPLCLVAKTHV